MARAQNKLTAKAVAALNEPGRHSDGGGLYLVVTKTGSRKWAFLYRWEGKLTELGLGSARDVTLAQAREKAAEARALIAAGTNPLATKRASVRPETFGEAADKLIEAMKPSWRNAKHGAQWDMTLREYAAPLRSISIAEVTTSDVLKVLKPIWQTKPETASRLRGRIERVLDSAKARGLRTGENPAAWRGNLALILPPAKKLSRGHHTALPYVELPSFVVALRTRRAMAALALEFTILTAARSGESTCATWSEIDFANGLWTVPGERMKSGRPHRVPLSKRAVEILHTVEPLRDPERGDWVFPGQARGRPISGLTMHMLLRRMKIDVTPHGFRSTFRDWAGDETHHAREIIEAALAHVVGDKAEQAYRRGDALEKRRLLMQHWADFCGGTATGKVVPITRAAR